MKLLKKRERLFKYRAEGATTPETLRQKDREDNNSGKRHVLTEGVNLSGTNTDGVTLVLYEIN